MRKTKQEKTLEEVFADIRDAFQELADVMIAEWDKIVAFLSPLEHPVRPSTNKRIKYPLVRKIAPTAHRVNAQHYYTRSNQRVTVNYK